MNQFFTNFRINKNTFFVAEDSSMSAAVELMLDRKISSVLVLNKEDSVVGILTERDVVRKFTLLDMSDKLTRTVGTVMGRGVKFVSPDAILDDLVNLHFELGMRHFPVSKVVSPKRKEIEGIISVSDALRYFLQRDSNAQIENKKIQTPILVALLCRNEKQAEKYNKDFSQYPIEFFPITNMHDLVKEHGVKRFQILVDFDGFSQKELAEVIPQIGSYRGNCILAMSQPSMVAAFRKMISGPNRHLKVCIKPLDLAYCTWLFADKWQRPDS